MDDVCFSLGVLAGKLSSGSVVNIFSVSSYTAHGPGDPIEVSRARDHEDGRFAELQGIVRLNVGRLDSPLRGQEPFDLGGLESEVSELRPILRDMLVENTVATTKPLLFCPSGIGGHRDHLIVRDCVLADFERVNYAYRVVFYEDLHYASGRVARDRGLFELVAAMSPGGSLRRYRFPVGGEKLSLVRLYCSQFAALPEDLADFTPADGSGEPHEAVWATEEIEEFDRL